MGKKSANINDIAILAAQKSDYLIKNTLPITQAVFEALSELLVEKGSVHIHGFGKFEMKSTPEKKLKHPTSGEELIIPAHNIVSFSAMPKLKEQMNALPTENT